MLAIVLTLYICRPSYCCSKLAFHLNFGFHMMFIQCFCFLFIFCEISSFYPTPLPTVWYFFHSTTSARPKPNYPPGKPPQVRPYPAYHGDRKPGRKATPSPPLANLAGGRVGLSPSQLPVQVDLVIKPPPQYGRSGRNLVAGWQICSRPKRTHNNNTEQGFSWNR